MLGRFIACAAFLGAASSGCCLDTVSGLQIHDSSTGGTSTASSSGASTTGFQDVGRPVLWMGGVGALDTSKVPPFGRVPFDETCFYNPSDGLIYLSGASAIDGARDVWVQLASPEVQALLVWTPEQLAQSCTSRVPSLTLGTPRFNAIAFDSEGNLWGSVPAFSGPSRTRIVGYSAGDLKGAGNQYPPATWSLAGNCDPPNSLCDPTGLAFDAYGFLWVASTFSLQAFAPSTLTGPSQGADSGSGPLADLEIATRCNASGYDDGGIPCLGSFLAFDSAGNLWFSSNGSNSSPGECHLTAYSRAQLENAKDDGVPAPVRDLFFPSPTVLCGALAFDADGNLWVGTASDWNGAGQPASEASSDWDAGVPNLFRLPATSLALDLGPDPTIVNPDITLAVPGFPDTSLAFMPIPAGLPIQP